MDIGIIGLSASGKSTIFNCLIRSNVDGSGQGDRVNLGVAKVPDSRLDRLAVMFQPERVVPAEVRYVDVPFTPRGLGKTEGFSGQLLNHLSKCDALLHVVREFGEPSVPLEEGSVDAERDIATMDLELAYSDMGILERRRQRLEDTLKGATAQERQPVLREQALISRIEEGLENSVNVREQQIAPDESKSISGYQFLTAKPMLLLVNIGEEDLARTDDLEAEMADRYRRPGVGTAVVSAKLEEELAQLEEDEAQVFRDEMNVGEPATDKILRRSYDLLGLVSFFTTASSEVRAWSVPRNTEAVKAAGRIHTDMERGFIRAEVIGYDDLVECGGLAEARKRGLLRLEGKGYQVQDGDVITFLFNV